MHVWPEWWRFEVDISPHVVDRMRDRGFSETDLRTMLNDASDYRASAVPGRYVIVTEHENQPWEVVVEPDELENTLIVVTAYEVES